MFREVVDEQKRCFKQFTFLKIDPSHKKTVSAELLMSPYCNQTSIFALIRKRRSET